MKDNYNGVVCDAEDVFHLLKECENLELASQHLKEHITLEANNIGNEDLLKELNKLYPLLSQCIQNLTDSTKDLYQSDAGSKDITEAWDSVIFNSEEILGCLIKILLSWDQAHLNRIGTSLNSFLLAVYDLKEASLEALPDIFYAVLQKLEEALLLIERRTHNICSKQQQETLAILSLQLHTTIRFLALIFPFAIRSQYCVDAKACRDFVVNKVKDIVGEMKKEASFGSENYSLQEPGKYMNTLNQVFEHITVNPGERGIDRLPLLSTIKPQLEDVLKHSICVALTVSSQDYSSIMTSCENVLQQIQVLSKLEESDFPRPSDVDVLLDVIVDVLEALEVKVNASVMKLIVEVLTEPFVIVDSIGLTLSKAIISKIQDASVYRKEIQEQGNNTKDFRNGILEQENTKDFKKKIPDQRANPDYFSKEIPERGINVNDYRKEIPEQQISSNGYRMEIPEQGINADDFRKEIQSKLAEFEKEIDRLYQIGGLVIACINDSSKVRRIESSLAILGWLEVGLVTATLKVISESPPQSLFQVQTLSKFWKEEVTRFRQLVYHLMETDALLQVTKQEIHLIWAEVRDSITHRNGFWLQTKSKRTAALVTRLLDLNQDIPYLTVKQINDLNIGVAEIEKHERKILNENVDEKIRKSFVKRLQFVLTTVSCISSALSSRATFIQSETEEDLYGCRVYDAGINAAKHMLNSNTMDGTLLLSNISAVEVDKPSNVEVLVNDDSSASTSVHKPQDSENIQKWCSSFQSIFKDRTLKTVQRNANANGQTQQCKECPKETSLCVTKPEESNDVILNAASEDITNFLLSRSTNTLRNSTRASKRNISLKVKEMRLDIGDVVSIPRKEAPRYVSPFMEFLDKTTVGSFAEIIGKMERFTSSCTSAPTRKTLEINTFGGNDHEKIFKHDLFYSTFHPLFAESQSSDDKAHKPSTQTPATVEANISDKEYSAPLSLTNILDRYSRNFIRVNKNGENDFGLEKVWTPDKISKDISYDSNFQSISYSNSDLVESLALQNLCTPEMVSTPQRLQDLKLVQMRLEALKCF